LLLGNQLAVPTAELPLLGTTAKPSPGPIPGQLRLCWLPLPFQRHSADSGSNTVGAESGFYSKTMYKGCKISYAAEMVLLFRTTPISVRHVFGYKPGK